MSEALSAALPPVKRRNAELVMLLFAIGITLFALIEASLTRNGEMPPNLFLYGGLFGGLALFLAGTAWSIQTSVKKFNSVDLSL